jgi:hypothetical protein
MSKQLITGNKNIKVFFMSIIIYVSQRLNNLSVGLSNPTIGWRYLCESRVE